MLLLNNAKPASIQSNDSSPPEHAGRKRAAPSHSLLGAPLFEGDEEGEGDGGDGGGRQRRLRVSDGEAGAGVACARCLLSAIGAMVIDCELLPFQTAPNLILNHHPLKNAHQLSPLSLLYPLPHPKHTRTHEPDARMAEWEEAFGDGGRKSNTGSLRQSDGEEGGDTAVLAADGGSSAAAAAGRLRELEAALAAAEARAGEMDEQLRCGVWFGCVCGVRGARVMRDCGMGLGC